MDPFDHIIGSKSKIAIIATCVLSMIGCGIGGQIYRDN